MKKLIATLVYILSMTLLVIGLYVIDTSLCVKLALSTLLLIPTCIWLNLLLNWWDEQVRIELKLKQR